MRPEPESRPLGGPLDWMLHPYALLGMSGVFFSTALLLSWPYGGGYPESDAEARRHWGVAASQVLFGVIAFGVGIRGLCVRRLPAGSDTSMRPGKFLTLAALGMVAAAAINWVAGQRALALLMIAPIPIAFVGWGLSFLFQSAEKRRALANLSEGDRARIEELSRDVGERGALLVGIPLAALAVVAYWYWKPTPLVAGAVFGGCVLLTIPVTYRLAAPLREIWAKHGKSEASE